MLRLGKIKKKSNTPERTDLSTGGISLCWEVLRAVLQNLSLCCGGGAGIGGFGIMFKLG